MDVPVWWWIGALAGFVAYGSLWFVEMRSAPWIARWGLLVLAGFMAAFMWPMVLPAGVGGWLSRRSSWANDFMDSWHDAGNRSMAPPVPNREEEE